METISAGNPIAKIIPPDTAKSNKKNKKTAMDKKNISNE